MKAIKKLTLLILLASILLAACGAFFDDECYDDHDDQCDSEYYEDEDYDDEYAEEEAYEEYLDEAQSEELTDLAGSPKLSIESIPEYADPAFEVFNQYIDVFGVGVYATSDIPESKVFHAAGIMAQYLDNDEDGVPDAPNVIRALQAKQASIYIFPRPDSRAEEEFFDNIEHLLDSGKLMIQPLYGEEIILDGAARGEFDVSLEEILHIITNSGYAYAYPDIFGEEPGSAIAEAMDKARGGYFEGIPDSYPAGAWFTYDDETCDYACMISEYHYWALTSLLGGQDFSGRGDEISHEWRLNTPDKLRNGDPDVYALLTNPDYPSPSVLPDGNYQP